MKNMNSVLMMIFLMFVIMLLIMTSSVNGQRSPYAGQRGSGYKDRFRPQSNVAVVQPSGQVQNNQNVGNRFDGGPINNLPVPAPTTVRLPVDAYGDSNVVNILNRRPVEKQPYWFVNYQAIEAHRNPQQQPLNQAFTAPRSSFLSKL